MGKNRDKIFVLVVVGALVLIAAGSCFLVVREIHRARVQSQIEEEIGTKTVSVNPGETNEDQDFRVEAREIDPETDVEELPNNISRVKICYTVTNNRDTTATDVQITSDLEEMFGDVDYNYVALETAGVTANPEYNGAEVTELLVPGQSLDTESSWDVCIQVEYNPDNVDTVIENRLDVTGTFESN